MTKRGLFILGCTLALVALLTVPLAAQNRAAKSAVKVSEQILLNEVTTDTLPPGLGWASLLAGEPVLLKNGSPEKDFIVTVAIECGMYTETSNKGQKGGTAESNALAGVRLRVILDKGTTNEQIAVPWAQPNVDGAGEFAEDFHEGINFCRRNQNLKTVLGGVLESCEFDCDVVCDQVCLDGGGSVDDCCYADCSFTKDDCLFSDEEITLAMRTLSAHSFTFLLTDVGRNAAGENFAGAVHTIDVEVMVDLGEETITDDLSSASAKATALIGRGTVSVQEVRLIKDADVIYDPDE